MTRLIITLLNLSTLLSIDCTPIFATRKDIFVRNKHKLEECQNLLHLDNNIYKKDVARNISGIPADMHVHWKTGNVFFTLISEEMRMTLQVVHPSGEFETIKVAGLGQSTCVDNLNDIIYLATDSGVYKYKEDGSIELYTALGEDVMYLSTSAEGATMYIATWPQNRVSKLTNNGQKSEMFTKIPNGHGITVDTRNNIYFVASKTTYVLQNGQSIPIKIKGLLEDKMTGVFVSRSDEVYAMDEFSTLYILDPVAASAVPLGSFDISGVNTFAMDSADNILIGIKGYLLKFTALEKNPCPEHDNKIDKRQNFAVDKPHERVTRVTRKSLTEQRTTTNSYEEEEEEEDEE